MISYDRVPRWERSPFLAIWTDRAVRSSRVLRAFFARSSRAYARLFAMTTVAQSSLAEEIARVSRLGNLSASHLAEATGGDPSSARRWIRGERTPSGEHAKRALELAALVERLAHVMDTRYIPVWLVKPIQRLDDRRPVDAIRAGDYQSVSRVVASLEGMPVS